MYSKRGLPLTLHEIEQMSGKESKHFGRSLAKPLTSQSAGTESCKRGRQKHPTETTRQVQDSRVGFGREALGVVHQKDEHNEQHVLL